MKRTFIFMLVLVTVIVAGCGTYDFDPEVPFQEPGVRGESLPDSGDSSDVNESEFEAPDDSNKSAPSVPAEANESAPGAPLSNTVTLHVVTHGRGLIASSPEGIYCGSYHFDDISDDCTVEFSRGATVDLTATPIVEEDFSFYSWGGACSGSGLSCTLVMDSDKNISAEFRFKDHVYYHDVNINVEGSGMVRVEDENRFHVQDCDSSCVLSDVVEGKKLVLKPVSGSDIFSGWSGDCDGVSYCSLEVTSERTVSASFTAPPNCPSSVTYQGHTYPVVLIGGQCWLAENLRNTVDAFGNPVETYCFNEHVLGDVCYQGYPDLSLTGCPKTESERALYDNFSCTTCANVVEDCSIRFYSWHSATKGGTSQGICPDGWRLPTLVDIDTLQAFAGYSMAGTNLKSRDHWYMREIEQNIYGRVIPGLDVYGFNAVPVGERYRMKNPYDETKIKPFNEYIWSYADMNVSARFWLQDDVTSGYHKGFGHIFMFHAIRETMARTYLEKERGLSVRCIMD